MTTRIYVLGGQGVGISGTLPSLVQRLRAIGTVSTHDWSENIPIVTDIKKLAADAIVILIGYSLGANEMMRVAAMVWPRKIALAVGYDPSRASPLARPDTTQPVPNNVLKTLCYYNPPNAFPDTWTIGGALYVGKNVIVVPVVESHILGIPADENLHLRTLKAAVNAANVPVLHPGMMHSADVKRAQQLLGFKPPDDDGHFGTWTEAAVRKFQAVMKLSAVDGIIGRDTWAALEAPHEPVPLPPRPIKQNAVA